LLKIDARLLDCDYISWNVSFKWTQLSSKKCINNVNKPRSNSPSFPPSVLRLQLFHTDDECISLAVRLLDGTALQWFVNLSLKNQRPSSWNSFKDALILHFQPPDFQENLYQWICFNYWSLCSISTLSMNVTLLFYVTVKLKI